MAAVDQPNGVQRTGRHSVKVTGASVRRQHARAEMREAILSAARSMLDAEGVEQLSMRAIARELRYSPAGLYEYFASKDDLLCALYCEGSEGLTGKMQAALDALPLDASGADRMRAMARSYRSFAKEHSELYRLAFGEKATAINKDEGSQSAFDLLAETVARDVESGGFVQMHPAALAIGAWATVHGFVMLEIAGFFDKMHPEGDVAPVDELFEASLALLEQGFLRR